MFFFFSVAVLRPSVRSPFSVRPSVRRSPSVRWLCVPLNHEWLSLALGRWLLDRSSLLGAPAYAMSV